MLRKEGLQLPECPAFHACSDRNPWRVPARAGAQESGTELQCFDLLRAAPNTLPALLVPAAGDPARLEPCPGAASGRKNRPLHASGVGTALRVKEGAGSPEGLCLAQGHTLCCLRAMKPESRWGRGKKDDVGVGSWPCWRENGEFSWTHLPGAARLPHSWSPRFSSLDAVVTHTRSFLCRPYGFYG